MFSRQHAAEDMLPGGNVKHPLVVSLACPPVGQQRGRHSMGKAIAMKTQALICDEKQNFSLEQVELPEPGPKQMLLRTLYSGVSIGTEFALITGKLSWGPYPLVTGYQAVGVAEKVGAEVQGYAVGDKVYYRGHEGPMTRGGKPVSCVSGTHAGHAVVSCVGDNAANLPAEADPAVSSLFVMPAVGLHGADLANPRMGQVAVVYGVGLIGLGVVAQCSFRGCLVVAVDVEPRNLEIARQLGADVLVDATKQDVGTEVYTVAPRGADVVFEATGIPALVAPAINLCRDYGSFIWQGYYGSAPFPYSFVGAHMRHLTMYHPCNDGLAPCRRAVI
jgi:2-desacetyl-2-hydroxyethyl bacteriochlorophyllide A dehydrogenase